MIRGGKDVVWVGRQPNESMQNVMWPVACAMFVLALCDRSDESLASVEGVGKSICPWTCLAEM